ncbi:hypothetical protein [Pseudomonas matsuisoli]|uniref:hypothetical protein n=1 Tax=Pseudomonas matsuisoli TaxID=1515666 RepID=UPI001668EDF0|nr:hypothetical protein [Pseudomonas matsuisoli]
MRRFLLIMLVGLASGLAQAQGLYQPPRVIYYDASPGYRPPAVIHRYDTQRRYRYDMPRHYRPTPPPRYSWREHDRRWAPPPGRFQHRWDHGPRQPHWQNRPGPRPGIGQPPGRGFHGPRW